MHMFNGRRKWQGEEHGWIRQHSLGLTLATMLVAQTLYAVWSGVYVFSREEPFDREYPLSDASSGRGGAGSTTSRSSPTPSVSSSS